MTQKAFADLCGVSKQAIGKHAAAGRLVLAGRKVDVRASLERLEGHLDEAKRRTALLRLAGIEPAGLGELGARPSAADGDEPWAPGESAAAGGQVIDFAAKSAKARGEEARAAMLEMELLRQQGQLVEVGEVLRAIEDAVTTFWIEVERLERQDACEIAAALNLSMVQARRVRELLKNQTRALRSKFANALRCHADRTPTHLRK